MGERIRQRAGPSGCGGCVAAVCGRFWLVMPGGRYCEVPGVDICPGVGRAQRTVSSLRRCVAELRLLGYRAKRSHGWGP